jgi:hypothetical protein
LCGALGGRAAAGSIRYSVTAVMRLMRATSWRQLASDIPLFRSGINQTVNGNHPVFDLLFVLHRIEIGRPAS